MKILLVFAFFLIFSLIISGCVSFSKNTPSITSNVDLRQDSEDNITIRNLANPIPDESTFNLIVQSVITDNPFGCVPYTSDGKNHDPIEKINENYTAQIFYKDPKGNIVSTREETYNSSTAYASGIATIPAITQLDHSQGTTANHDAKFDLYTVTLKCHDPNGEIYYVVFTRDYVMLANYSDDSVRIGFETWADTVASLNSPDKESPDLVATPLISRYKQGDIVDFSPIVEKEPHLIILDYNDKTGQYQFDIIFRNENKSWGYRIYPEPRWGSMTSIEKHSPYLITHVNITDIETRFPSKKIFEKTR